MAVAEVASPPVLIEERRVVLPHVSWDTYERLLADDEERRVPRITYDRGVLELVSPSTPHEEDARLLTLLVDIVAAKLGIPTRSVGSMTYRREDLERGFEPDASFYVQHEASIRGRRQIDLKVDPPPDVVIEMEYSRTAVDKLALFAAMGIPEVWRSDGRRVSILVLTEGAYQPAATSHALPVLTPELIQNFLAASRESLSHEWFHLVSDWARAQRGAD